MRARGNKYESNTGRRKPARTHFLSLPLSDAQTRVNTSVASYAQAAYKIEGAAVVTYELRLWRRRNTIQEN